MEDDPSLREDMSTLSPVSFIHVYGKEGRMIHGLCKSLHLSSFISHHLAKTSKRFIAWMYVWKYITVFPGSLDGMYHACRCNPLSSSLHHPLLLSLPLQHHIQRKGKKNPSLFHINVR